MEICMKCHKSNEKKQINARKMKKKNMKRNIIDMCLVK